MKYLITSALPYPNGPLHLGHVAGVFLPADITYRWRKAMGDEVISICGTDDHGVALEIASKKQWITTSELVQRYRAEYQQGLQKLWCDFTMFHGTDTPQHTEIVHAFFWNLYHKGLIEERTLHQMYCHVCEMFLADRYIVGICNKCGSDWAYGDQCEQCGSMIDPTQLIQPQCKTCSSKNLEVKATQHLYLLLDKGSEALQTRLEEKAARTTNTWKDNVLSTSLNKWMKEGLEARCITRDIACGVSVPLPGYENKVFYVWFDAPLGYISITKYRSDTQISPSVSYLDYRADPDTRLIQFLGKDNIVFHSIFWPMMLMQWWQTTDGRQYILPDNIPANDFLNLEGKKFSTSRKYALWLDEMLEQFPADMIRMYLITILPETSDSDWKWREFQDRCNNLADTLGNLRNRVITLMIKYNDGQFEVVDVSGPEDVIYHHFLENIVTTRDEIIWHLEAYRLRAGWESLMTLIRSGNQLIDQIQPRIIGKTDPLVAKRCLDVLGMYLSSVGYLLSPRLPHTSQIILSLLHGADYPELRYDHISNSLPPFIKITEKPALLFVKITDTQVEEQLAKLEADPTS